MSLAKQQPDGDLAFKRDFSAFNPDFFERAQVYKLTFGSTYNHLKSGHYQYVGREHEGNVALPGKFVFIDMQHAQTVLFSGVELYRASAQLVAEEMLKDLGFLSGESNVSKAQPVDEPSLNAMQIAFGRAKKPVTEAANANNFATASFEAAPETVKIPVIVEQADVPPKVARRPYFKPNAYKEDMSQPLDLSSRFMVNGQTFIDTELQDDAKAFFAALKGQVSNAVGMMFVLGANSGVQIQNMSKSLGFDKITEMRAAAVQNLEKVAEIIDLTQGQTRRMFDFYCQRFQVTPVIPVKEKREAEQVAKAEIEIVEVSSLKEGVKAMLDDMLEHIPEKYECLKMAQCIAAETLDAQHFAAVTHYLRPNGFNLVNAYVDEPESVRAYYEGYDTPGLRQIALDGFKALVASERFQEIKKLGAITERMACEKIELIAGELGQRMDGPRGRVVKAFAAEAAPVVVEKPAVPALPVRDVVIQKPVVQDAVAPISVPVVETSVTVAAPQASAAFNHAAAVAEQEKTLISRYSSAPVLLDYCVNEVKLGPVGLAMLSRVFLRAEKQGIEVAAQELNLDPCDAEVALGGAVMKTEKLAKERGDVFILDQLKTFKIA